jgi:hypothetical protein
MPTEIDLGMPPAGYAIEGAKKDGDSVLVQFREFVSTEDGQHLAQRLEGIPDEILRLYRPVTSPWQVGTMLAVIRRDGKGTVYVNEISQVATVRPTGPVLKGASVTKNDIAEFESLDLGVVIPENAGVLYLFPVGWRRGLFYDFGPIAGPNPEPRNYDLGAALGQAYCHVLFQERFGISDSEWSLLLQSKWFPFVGLNNATIDSMLAYVRAGWSIDDMLEKIVGEVKGFAPQMLDTWKQHAAFAPHLSILERAVERFLSDDFMSCTGLLFPRIEGIMRTYQSSLGIVKSASAKNLARAAVSKKLPKEKCLLLPHKFENYLQEVFFASFNPRDSGIDVSRHSVAHGIASTNEFNQKSAAIGLLVTHQLAFCFT